VTARSQSIAEVEIECQDHTLFLFRLVQDTIVRQGVKAFLAKVSDLFSRLT